MSEQLIKEIDEELRWQRYLAIVKKYWLGLLISILVVVMVGGYVYYRYQQRQQLQEAAISKLLHSRDLSMTEMQELHEANKTHKLPGGIILWGGLQLTHKQIRNKRLDEALTTIRSLKQHSEQEDLYYQQLLGFYEAQIMLVLGHLDEAESMFQDMLNGNNFHKSLVLEYLAEIALQRQDKDKAVSYLQQISDAPDMNYQLRQRSLQLIQQLNK